MKNPPLSSENNPPSKHLLDLFRYSRRALELVWTTSRHLALVFAALTLVAGVLPAAVAWIGQLIVDGVVAAIAQHQLTGSADTRAILWLVAAEAGVVALIAGSQRGISTCQALLRALMGQRINLMILEKALTLKLAHFEDSEFYDKLTRARREASTRPLSLVTRTFGLVQNGISLASYGVLLVQFSPWTVLILLAGGIPEFLAEAKFSGDKFRLFRWRSPETRMQMYLETVLAREDYAKEVKLFRLGPKLLQRYRAIFAKLFAEDRKLTLRRDSWGFALGLIGTAAFYGAYGWIALSAIRGDISLGQMTMYLLLFRQGQSAVSASLSAISGMYEDNLYLSNLYEYLEQKVPAVEGELRQGPQPGDGVRFEQVSFSYPGSEEPALQNVSLHLKPGDSLALVGENGSGKTTLIKLLTRLYRPTSGRILLDGLDLQQWNGDALRARIGVIFQDFGRYQFLVGENIGAGDIEHFEDRQRWEQAADMGMAKEFIDKLPQRYDTQLGKWFKNGRELSGGQWQKIALARAFMRTQADILVLDEPTATMDAAAEATIFEHFRELSRGKMTILISHRFSTVRMADQIVVIDKGHLVERGSHEELMKLGGQYAYLFSLQAEGYR
ncbi:ABC transporter ATP-binding protein [Desulfuromonas sp. AOP6]|uniref:ABC transporter ATP-binding protein n=1 Tax=Desulfuromonas sp. AOP6 TaxID=1566351 RepID=UPI00127A5A2B|nr:ABC transporter ATP-binding protein [Desulfuromonas sp. AOP6]BCA80833.1 ABC transporter permease [Desulfuromonas sp. AOP6]